ncbi:unnamed protein product [Darwinula stevensoni]|uniref:CRAL-TRIO domain-containing protein n=1 Tax=Darwinula stevensoni TaxID=69355 RepID=A0A7R9A8I7_9CRUS|nr:unnamed protein product [Darwinula stevensoni]CAG0896389.1 unnamed protein product [Darwinula stevensoni]
MQEANYPEHLKRLYLLNMPRFFTMALAVVRPFLNQTTQEKIVCLGSKDQFEPVLTKAISKDVLPKFWGGNRVDEDGDPKCSSLLQQPYRKLDAQTGKGGKVPKSLYRTSKGAKEAQEEEKNEEKLGGVERRAVSLRGGEALNLECRAPHPGSLLSWEFSTEKEGVEYLVLRVDGEQVDIHQEDVSGRRVREKERANSHQETVSGEILLQEPGLYCLRFHSKATSDRLSYAILVTPPPDRL